MKYLLGLGVGEDLAQANFRPEGTRPVQCTDVPFHDLLADTTGNPVCPLLLNGS